MSDHHRSPGWHNCFELEIKESQNRAQVPIELLVARTLQGSSNIHKGVLTDLEGAIGIARIFNWSSCFAAKCAGERLQVVLAADGSREDEERKESENDPGMHCESCWKVTRQ